MITLDKLRGSLRRHLKKATKALFSIGATVLLVQGLSFFANLFVIRSLSVPEYALLTASLSIFGVMTVLADSGLYQAVMTVGGLHHENRAEKAQILQRCLKMTLVTGTAASVVILPVWLAMTTRLDGGLISTTFTGIILFGGFFFILGINVFKAMLLLEGRRADVQRLDVIKTAIRLALIGASVFAFPYAPIVVLCGAIADSFCWRSFKKMLRPLLNERAPCSPQVKAEIMSVFWRTMPASVYKALSSQLFLLLLALSGSVAGVAGAGAIAKFHQFFNFPIAAVVMLLHPRLAKAASPRERNQKLLLFTSLGWAGALLTLCFLVTCAGPLLRLFGNEYSGLVSDMRILMSGSAMLVMAAMLRELMGCRGWIISPVYLVASDFVSLVAAILFGNASSLHGYAVMNCIMHGGALLSAVGYACYCFVYKRDVKLA